MTETHIDIARRAAAFIQVRRAHETEMAEDYVELIADLIAADGEARQVDIANCMGVSQPTVVKIVQRLQRDGLVSIKPYRSIFLTNAGRDMADRSRRRHRIVLDFLKAIGVSDATAELDAEGVEHHVSEETLQIFKRFTAERLKTLK
jgi:DtxR family manganese transport transcriptional regulator